jgi:hypothetical protein
MVCVYKAAYWVVAGVVSLWRGWYGVTILVTGGLRDTWCSEKKGEVPSIPAHEPTGERKLEHFLPPGWHFHHHGSWWAHEIFINFLGSLIGWAAAYYFIFCHRRVDGLTDVFLLIVAIAGIFGFLPWMLSRSPLR